jgi:hypothetical protein
VEVISVSAVLYIYLITIIAIKMALLWKGTLLPNNNHLPFHPPPPFLQAKDVNLIGEYSVKLLFLVG